MGHPHIQWFADPAVLAPIALMVWIYVRRFREARREAGGRGAGPLQALAFGGAVLALLAPLLLLLSLSRVIMRPATRRLARVERALGPLASPWTAIAIWLGTMYLWHIPAIYDAAAEHPLLHAAEHLSFFAAGLALWWPLVQPVPMRNALTGLQPLAYIALAKGGLAALGLFLAWSSTAHYPWYEDTPRIWGLNPVEDQNVAGVIMMVEQSLTLVLVMVWVFIRMLTRSEQEELRRERLEDARVSALDA
jgi:putative membrane protein